MSKRILTQLSLERGWLRHGLPFGLLLLIQVALALFRELPLAVSDETVYLANARFLSGTAPMPTLHGSYFFHFGYSLFLVPAFWLFESPTDVYTASLVVSALLMSTLYLSLYYILASIFGVTSRLAMLVSFVTCLYPPLLLRANFAWGESAYVPGFMLTVALLGVLLRRKSMHYAVLFGLFLGFMYTIHPRSLPLILVAMLYMLLWGRSGILRWRAVIAALSAVVALFIGTRLMLDELKSVNPEALSEVQIRPLLAHLMSLQGLHDFLLALNNQLLYLVQSSFGLFLIGLFAVGLFYWQRRRNGLSTFIQDVPTATLTFFCLAWLGSLFLSSAFLSLPEETGKLLKGRYVDGNSALIFAFGLTAILWGKDKVLGGFTPPFRLSAWSLGTKALAALLISASTAVLIYSVSVFLPVVVSTNSLGFYPYLEILGSTRTAILSASTVAIAGFVVLSLARSHLRFAAVAAVACLFLFASAYDYRFVILPLQERVARSSTLASYIRTYFESPATIAYDVSYGHPVSYFSYEYLLPHTRFLPFASAAGEKPPTNIVISGRNWQMAETLGAQFWQAEPHVLLVGADQALWTLPGPQQSALLQQTDYTNTVLGLYALPAWSVEVAPGIQVQPIWGVWQHGFYHPVTNGQRSSLVWFNGRASLRASTGANPPRYVLLNLLSTVQQATPLRVEANGETVFADSVPSGNWCTSFPLPQYPDAANTTIDLFLPSITGSGTASPQANMVVRGITLLDHAPEIHQGLTPETLPQGAYRSNIALASQPYPKSLAQGAMSTLKLIVNNRGDEPWPTLCEIGQVPGSVQLGILWFRSGSADRTLAARAAEGRAALPYALAPGSSLSVTAILAPITQSGAPLPPGDYEVWIGPVQEGVTWFFQEGDDVLKVPVRVSR